MQWAKSFPLVIIGLTELPNSRWAKAHPAHPQMHMINLVHIIQNFQTTYLKVPYSSSMNLVEQFSVRTVVKNGSKIPC